MRTPLSLNRHLALEIVKDTLCIKKERITTTMCLLSNYFTDLKYTYSH